MNEKLIKIYTEAKQRIIFIITYKRVRGNAVAYELALLTEIERELKRLNEKAINWVQTEIPAVYMDSVTEVNAAYLGLAANGEAIGVSMAGVHTAAIEGIVVNTIESLITANTFLGRELRDSVREAGLEAAAEKFSTGSTVRQMQKRLEQKLLDRGLTQIKDKAGRNISIEAYAAMVSRSTTAEATNRAKINQVAELGYDLVEMTIHYPTCSVCAHLQGRVYSVSGRDKRFPKLSNAYKGPWANVHPNCRHRLVPYIESAKSAGQLKADIKLSNRSFEIDPRTKAEVDAYNKEQAEKAEVRNNRRRWDKFKAVLGDDAPKSFSAFMRAKNDADKWMDLKQLYKDVYWQLEYQKNRTVLQEHKIPFEHIPKSVIDKINEDGIIELRRYYGASKKAILDLHYTDHGNSKQHKIVPHAHNWINKAGNTKPDIDRELTKAEIIANKEIKRVTK